MSPHHLSKTSLRFNNSNIIIITITIIILLLLLLIMIIVIIITKNKFDINPIQIGKRQLHFIRLNHVLFDLNKLSKDTDFMFTLTPFSSVKLTASKNF